MKIKADRITTEQGGHGMDIQLSIMRTTNQVFWSSRGNSYVIRPDGKIVSINGMGEIRWYVEDWNHDEESNSVRNFFLEA